ncbi:GNAT family N-acetyltransferase [Pedobacter cryotolerans]|uniref:GNAT family N-acetyltransferase n=1 Tax=Pedobacter cryotolerans TaxID=2571270 RepID=A0A4U1C8W5_9SPHI|nr:GNAT family N-acetyltransferase [Pedobacter cryotolerans]TKC02078.1 GNAT family N-acetyltransferase [Pedobacter cryotolerans]
MLKLQFTSFPTLETERLILRAHTNADAKALFALRSNETVMKYIYRERPKDIFDVQTLITTLNKGFENGDNLVWAIALKNNPSEMIGEIGYYRTDFANHRAEIGYMLNPDYWRKGIISEALIKAIAFGFKNINLHSICADVSPENNASRQILLKHGFEKEAYFKERYYFQGKFLDSEIYSFVNLS